MIGTNRHNYSSANKKRSIIPIRYIDPLYQNPSDRMSFIYTLENQNGIFYVGKTNLSLAARKNSHIKNCRHNSKLSAIINSSEFINIAEIECCKRDEVKKWERYWVCQLIAWGFDLVNIGLRPNKSTEHKQKTIASPDRDNTRIRFTSDELNLISALYTFGDFVKISEQAKCSCQLIRIHFKQEYAPIWIHKAICSFYIKKGYEYAKLYYRAAFQV